ncbi:MAG: hypothetical protein PHC66_03730 [Candidatus Nanoarchaeia archaeon]|nr:hypothetical protein [Candidatus Nanoarchaeia archaeon]MDD5239205.1 hypothetical protein [Candidatus Nanoarchaeia archaeon]
MDKRGAIDLASREILILVLVVIILAVVIGLAVSKLDLIAKTLEFLSGQGPTIAAST